MALKAAPNNLRSRIPMNLRGRMSVSYSKIHETAPQGDSHVETYGRGFRGRKLTGEKTISRRDFLKLTGGAVGTAFTSLLAACGEETTTAGAVGETPEEEGRGTLTQAVCSFGTLMTIKVLANQISVGQTLFALRATVILTAQLLVSRWVLSVWALYRIPGGFYPSEPQLRTTRITGLVMVCT
jgi:hypothetical protein